MSSAAQRFHTFNKQVNILVQSGLFSPESATAESRRQLLSHLAVPHRIPFPYQATMLIFSMIVDLSFMENFQILVMGAIEVCMVPT